MPSLMSRRKSETMMEIARAASALFAERGTDGVTVDTIAEAAGVSLRTFYRYFRTKEEAVAPILTVGARTWQESVAKSTHPDVLAGIADAIEMVLTPADATAAEALREARQVLRAMPTDPALRAVWLTVNDDSEQRLCEILEDKLSAASGAIAVRALAAAATAAIRISLEQWAVQPGAVAATDQASGPAALAAQAFSQLTTGIATSLADVSGAEAR